MALGATVTLALAGRAPVVGSDAAAVDACNSSAAAKDYSVTGVYRAESSTAEEVAAWQENRYEGIALVSPFRSAAPRSTVVVCIFRGDFRTPTGPPLVEGVPNPNHELLRVLVSASGDYLIDSAGYEGALRPETPSDWRALPH
jgi:hypothetical protein